jgi:phosphoesterase RecJ-like protein
MDKYQNFASFMERHASFIITTHDPADADGLGAELVMASLIASYGKQARLINASAAPHLFAFMDPARQVEQWNPAQHGMLPEMSALLMVDTSDEYNIGLMKDILGRVREIFAIDHHEPKPPSTLSGLIDPAAAATCQQVVEIAESASFEMDAQTAAAAYTGLVFDTGFFAYSKTGRRTFEAALYLLKRGANPSEAFRQLTQNASTNALLLQKRALSTLELHAGGRIASQVLRKEDLRSTGALPEDSEGLVNTPMRSREIAVSILVKESPEGKVRCSLRSKNAVNVSRIAQAFGGGGHVSAAGFTSARNVDETLRETIALVEAALEHTSGADCGQSAL